MAVASSYVLHINSMELICLQESHLISSGKLGMIMTVFMVILELMQAGANTKVLLSTRLMIDLDTPADLS